MEDLVLNIEQCNHLSELGIDMSDAILYHVYETVQKEKDGELYEEDEWSVRPDNVYNLNHQPNVLDYVPTYTLQEIWEKLPNQLVVDNVLYKLIVDGTEWWIGYIPFHPYTVEELPPLKCCALMNRPIDAYYELLCSVIENGEYKEKEK